MAARDDVERVLANEAQLQERADLVAEILSRLPLDGSPESRAVYLAWAIARYGIGDVALQAAQRLEAAAPGYIAEKILPELGYTAGVQKLRDLVGDPP